MTSELKWLLGGQGTRQVDLRALDESLARFCVSPLASFLNGVKRHRFSSWVLEWRGCGSWLAQTGSTFGRLPHVSARGHCRSKANDFRYNRTPGWRLQLRQYGSVKKTVSRRVMTDSPQWRRLYEAAMLELDPTKLLERTVIARSAFLDPSKTVRNQTDKMGWMR
jgi:hypothetical protein